MNRTMQSAGLMLALGLLVLTGCRTDRPVEVVHSPQYESRPLSEPVDMDLPDLPRQNPVSTVEPQVSPAPPVEPLPPESPTSVERPAPPAPSAQADQPASSEGRVHVVQRGDTLWSIAVKHYNDGQMWQRIAQVNGLGDGNRIAEGQRLSLP